MVYSLLGIGSGAALGAVFRWLLGLGLDRIWPAVPLGTLAANLIGGFAIGLAFEFFFQHAEFSPVWRLFVITGFLGGLTTFSTFSLESSSLLLQRDYVQAIMHLVLHLAGSVSLTILGLYLARLSVSQ